MRPSPSTTRAASRTTSGATDFDVLVNDTDVEHNSLTLVSASVSASAGSASVVAGKVRFTPLAAFSGPAVITYVVSDGALQDSGTLTVTVGPDTVAAGRHRADGHVRHRPGR